MKRLELTRAAAILALTLAGVGVSAALAVTGEAVEPKPMPPGAINQCRVCHQSAVKAFDTTHHATLAQSCASCHGDTTEHLQSNLEKGEPGPIKSFKGLKAEDVNQTCLSCHDKGRQANWHGGLHDRRDVSCTSCHSVHSFKSARAQLKTQNEADTCNTCHTNIRNKGMRVSHHPVREGLMSCSSCHDPHDGTKPKMVKGESLNETCLTCHTEKRGPHLWEHAPVRENCAACHDPHGSNHEKLLVAKQPYLCQRCHLNTRHPGTLYDFRNTLTGASPSNRAVEHACKNCHQSVHGGNAPSGPYLGR
jgi:DmsE family decaheme c-type cytochrome